MLTLTRSADDSIVLQLPDGQFIEVFIDHLSATRVQLSIDAPKSVKILRHELIDERQDDS